MYSYTVFPAGSEAEPRRAEWSSSSMRWDRSSSGDSNMRGCRPWAHPLPSRATSRRILLFFGRKANFQKFTFCKIAKGLETSTAISEKRCPSLQNLTFAYVPKSSCPAKNQEQGGRKKGGLDTGSRSIGRLHQAFQGEGPLQIRKGLKIR